MFLCQSRRSAESSVLFAVWPTQPTRVAVIGHVLVEIGDDDCTTATNAELARRTGKTPGAVKRHLSAAYEAGILTSEVTYYGGTNRTISRGPRLAPGRL